MSVLVTHLYQCTNWHCCERLCSSAVNFFWRLFNAFAHFMMGDLQAHLLTLHWVFSCFWPKMAWPPCTTLFIHPMPQATVFFPRWKKSSKGNILPMWKKQKTAEVLRGIKMDKFKNYFEQWKKVSMGVLHQMENTNTLKVTEVSICKNKYTIFYK